MSAFGLSERGLHLIFRLDRCCVLEPHLQNSSCVHRRKEVKEVIFSVVLWNSILSSVSKEDVTHNGFAAMQLDGEAHSCGCCHRDAPARGLQR